MATASAGTELAAQVLALDNATEVLQAVEPSALIGAFGSSTWTLQPFDQLAVCPPLPSYWTLLLGTRADTLRGSLLRLSGPSISSL